MHTNFLLGEITVTENALTTLGRMPFDLIARHAINEHGHITAAELKQNKLSMRTCGTIISRYAVDPTQPKLGNVIVITPKSWSSTAVHLESERPRPNPI